MDSKPEIERFIIRDGTRPGSFMIWDRDIRGPAKLANARLAINLTRDSAEELKNLLAEFSSAPVSRETKS